MTFSALDLVVLALASWRLAHLLVLEEGPWRLFERLRQAAGIERVTTVTQDGLQTGYTARGPLAEGLLCVWCVSVWCATLFTLGVLLPIVGGLVSFAARLLAVSALSIGIHETIQYLKEH